MNEGPLRFLSSEISRIPDQFEHGTDVWSMTSGYILELVSVVSTILWSEKFVKN
jgi:hypothetical protein